ncbi:MAG: hypothetical protein JKY37_33015, partial [Nannocystaceae bacterium]|nr:hypothetical protein [Nannocystaceae bacterium]
VNGVDEVDAVDPFHDDEADVVIDADIEDLDDVGVTQKDGQSGLLQEATSSSACLRIPSTAALEPSHT